MSGSRKGKLNWSQEEIEFLEDNWGTKSLTWIANQLGRSPEGVKTKKARLGVGPFLENGDYLTLNLLYKVLFGRNINTYQHLSWIENRGLPVHTK